MTQHTRSAPLLSIVITTTGDVEVEPGEGFTEDHLDLMVRAVEAVRTAVVDPIPSQ